MVSWNVYGWWKIGKSGGEEIAHRFEQMIPANYLYQPMAGRSRAIQLVIEKHLGAQDRNLLVVFLDDDVRLSRKFFTAYESVAGKFGPGHYFGGSVSIDYEADPEPWTGVAGFIGFHVARRLLSLGQAVIGVDSMCELNYPRKLKAARLGLLEANSRFSFHLRDICDVNGLSPSLIAVTAHGSFIWQPMPP